MEITRVQSHSYQPPIEWESVPAKSSDVLSQPTPAETASKGGIINWLLNLFGYGEQKIEPKAEEIKISRAKRPAIAPPDRDAREQMLKVLDASRQTNKIVAKTLEDITEGELYKRLVTLFKDVAALNETLIKNTIEDSKDRSDTVKQLHLKLREISKEIDKATTAETAAKTTHAALTVLSVGTIVFVITGAAFAAATGFVPAALPAIMQAMSTTGFAVAQATSTAAAATAQGASTYFEGKRKKNEGEALERRHVLSEMNFEFKVSREEWNQFTKHVQNLWSALREIEDKRRETNRYTRG